MAFTGGTAILLSFEYSSSNNVFQRNVAVSVDPITN